MSADDQKRCGNCRWWGTDGKPDECGWIVPEIKAPFYLSASFYGRFNGLIPRADTAADCPTWEPKP